MKSFPQSDISTGIAGISPLNKIRILGCMDGCQRVARTPASRWTSLKPRNLTPTRPWVARISPPTIPATCIAGYLLSMSRPDSRADHPAGHRSSWPAILTLILPEIHWALILPWASNVQASLKGVAQHAGSYSKHWPAKYLPQSDIFWSVISGIFLT